MLSSTWYADMLIPASTLIDALIAEVTTVKFCEKIFLKLVGNFHKIRLMYIQLKSYIYQCLQLKS